MVVRTGLGMLVVFGLLQLVPYGWKHSNPPVSADAPWPNAEAERLARSACYDCHSNETDWPVYSYVAPFSWLVRSDVESGRDELNFSEWDRDDGEADDAADEIEDGSMPPHQYRFAAPGGPVERRGEGAASSTRSRRSTTATGTTTDRDGNNRGSG